MNSMERKEGRSKKQVEKETRRGFVPWTWVYSFGLWDLVEVLSMRSVSCFRIMALAAE